MSRRIRARRRLVLVGHSVVLGALGLGAVACGGRGGSGSEITPARSDTAFRTLPPVTPTLPPTTIAVAEPITYIVKRGDFPSLIVRRAAGGCKLADLEKANKNVDFDTFTVGTRIQIPADCFAEGVTIDNWSVTTIPGEFETDENGSVVPATAAKITGTYTIRKGDYWLKIARKFDCDQKDIRLVNPTVKTLIPKRTIRIPATCKNDPDDVAKEDAKSDSE
jgi:LysM repeat protein